MQKLLMIETITEHTIPAYKVSHPFLYSSRSVDPEDQRQTYFVSSNPARSLREIAVVNFNTEGGFLVDTDTPSRSESVGRDLKLAL